MKRLTVTFCRHTEYEHYNLNYFSLSCCSCDTIPYQQINPRWILKSEVANFTQDLKVNLLAHLSLTRKWQQSLSMLLFAQHYILEALGQHPYKIEGIYKELRGVVTMT